jgi:hypothetical protein
MANNSQAAYRQWQLREVAGISVPADTIGTKTRDYPLDCINRDHVRHI